MISAEEFADRKARLDQLRRDRDQAQGAYDEFAKRMAADFGVDSLEELKGLEEITRKRADKAEAAYRIEEKKLVEEEDGRQ